MNVQYFTSWVFVQTETEVKDPGVCALSVLVLGVARLMLRQQHCSPDSKRESV